MEKDKEDEQHCTSHPDRLPLFTKLLQVQEQKIDDLADKLSELAKIVSSHGTALKLAGAVIITIFGAIAASFVQFCFDKLLK